jgi:signal transduction histidine kinase/CheY-like chemotaxis protein
MTGLSHSRNSLFVRYGVLLALALFALSLQAVYSKYVIQFYRSPAERVATPFQYSNAQIILSVRPEAANADLEGGEILSSIDGRPFTGHAVLQEALGKAHPGDVLEVVAIRPDNGSAVHSNIRLAALQLTPYRFQDWLFAIVALLFVPALALLLGFGLAATRPLDLRAWLVLFLMMSFSQIYYLQVWTGPLHLVALGYRTFAAVMFSVWLVLLGIYFPERSPWDRKHPWVKWLFIAPVLLIACIAATNEVLSQHHLELTATWQPVVEFFQKVQTIVRLSAIGLFLFMLTVSIRQPFGTDVVRRLKIVRRGAVISLTPIFVLVVRGLIVGSSSSSLPTWISIPSILIVDLLPCTMVYVIVVRRALDPHVLLRQMIKYAFTKRAVEAFRFVALGLLFTTVAYVAVGANHDSRMAPKVAFALACLTVVFEIITTERMAQWIDRHLFGLAYHAEQLLLTFSNETLPNSSFKETDSLMQAVLLALQDAFQSSPTFVLLEMEGGYRVSYPMDSFQPDSLVLSHDGPSVEHLVKCNQPLPVYLDDPDSWVHRLPGGDQTVFRELKSEVVLPLVRDQRLIGIISLGSRRYEEPYSRTDLQLLHVVGLQTSLSLENSLLMSSLADEITQRERKTAEKDAADQANKTKSDFLARMSHELRTPLNAIIGYSEILEEEAEEDGNEKLATDLKKIRAAGKHLLSLINSILDISKIEAGKMELYLETFAVDKLVSDTLTIVQPLVTQNGNELRLSESHTAGSMLADLVKVRQVLFNLISNASKFTKNGVITLGVSGEKRADGDWVSFTVADTGIGMSPEHLGRLFQAFEQADSSTTSKYGGTGLGLAISRHFCRMMGGDIKVASELGKGTCFTVELPKTVNLPGQPKEPKPALIDIGGKLIGTILVIDDDDDTREIIQRELSPKGVRVVGASSGEEGLKKAKEIRPDLITLDILMQDIDGWQVLSRIKADPDLANIPVVMLSMMDEKSKGLSVGVSDYLTKPADRGQLASLVAKYLDSPGRARSDSTGLLLVDDDLANRSLMARTLREQGWRVQEAGNGLEALALLPAGAPELILLDLIMPEMDGLAFLTEIRKSPQWCDIPVVVITSKDLTDTERRLLNMNVVGVLEKNSSTLADLVHDVSEQLALKGNRKGAHG